MSDAEFVIFAGHAAMIRPEPGPAHAAGAVLTQWKKSDNMKTLEKGGSIALCGILLSAFPDRMVASIKSAEVAPDSHDAIHNDATVRAQRHLIKAGFRVSLGTVKEAMPSACYP